MERGRRALSIASCQVTGSRFRLPVLRIPTADATKEGPCDLGLATSQRRSETIAQSLLASLVNPCGHVEIILDTPISARYLIERGLEIELNRFGIAVFCNVVHTQ